MVKYVNEFIVCWIQNIDTLYVGAENPSRGNCKQRQNYICIIYGVTNTDIHIIHICIYIRHKLCDLSLQHFNMKQETNSRYSMPKIY